MAATPKTNEDLLTVAEVARKLRVHDTCVRRWIRQGTLEAVLLPRVNGNYQMYRIKRATLDTLLDPPQQPPVPQPLPVPPALRRVASGR